MEQAKFTNLLQPGMIGSLELKNRVVIPPMGTGLASEDGTVTEELINYYEERAKGGPGLIVVEFTCIDSPLGRGGRRQLLIDDDKFIPGLAALARAIKRHGAGAAIQLHHAGGQALPSVIGQPPVAPSAVIVPSPLLIRHDEPARELTLDEIEQLVEHFVNSARRAFEAGFDGVEIHGAHGYLVSQFLSPLSNKRQDKYGGSTEKRARFLLEIIRGIRSKLGKHYPLWCRLSAVELGAQGGITLEQTQLVAQMAQKAGADAISVSAHSVSAIRHPMAEPPGVFVPFAEAIKRYVSMPVIAAGRITPELGEQVLREGKADFVAIGRQFLADAYVVKKVTAGQKKSITPCICCLTCLDSVRGRAERIRCTVNPALGREKEWVLQPAISQKGVVVVGGGPAGMQSAIVAAQRGHRVILFEQGTELGGQLLLAAKPPFKGSLELYCQYLISQVSMVGVELRLSEKFGLDLLLDTKPDVVVLATGVVPFIPDIPGVHGENVILASQVLQGAETGQTVAVIGGELVGCETALYLLDKERKVTIMRRGSKLATKVNIFTRLPLLERLRQGGATILTGVNYEEITRNGVSIRSSDGERQFVKADTIVLACGVSPNTELVPLLKGKVAEVVQVGDCVVPRGIREAVEEGYQAGLKI